MNEVIISSSVNVPYSFTDKSGKERAGTTFYVLVSNGYGVPRVEKCTSPLNYTVIVTQNQLVFDYNHRLITDNL